MTGATAQLAAFAAATKYDDLPDNVRDTARDLLLDTLGAAVAGHAVAKGAIPTDLVASWGGAEEASIVGTDLRVPIPAACFANGELMNALDFDAILAPGHVTPYVIPPALAFAEVADASGEELITAVAVAHELGARVAAALDGMRAWDSGGDGGSPLSAASGYGSTIFGAAAGAASILGLQPDAIANLFGIVGFAAPVPGLIRFVTAPHSTHTKYTSSGQLAMNAAIGVQLAERGYRGDETILEGEYGFPRMFASKRCDWDFMLGGLGSEWRLLRNEFKPFPAFRMSHDALTAIRSLLDEHGIDPGSITKIETTADPLCTSECYTNPTVADHSDAQLSWPHLLAAAAYYREPTAWQIEAVGDPRVQELARRVEVIPIGDAKTAEQLLLSGGKVDKAYPVWLKSSVELHVGEQTFSLAAPPVTKGHRDNPMTRDELDAKYLANVGRVLSGDQAAESLEVLRALERHSTRDLVRVFSHVEVSR
jgi:2-methylcitrate dehydratase PrpD